MFESNRGGRFKIFDFKSYVLGLKEIPNRKFWPIFLGLIFLGLIFRGLFFLDLFFIDHFFFWPSFPTTILFVLFFLGHNFFGL